MTYIKARFTSKNNGSTAGLVLESQKFYALSLTAFSRMFPYSEAVKMERTQVSPEYGTWDEAFAHSFEKESEQ